MTDTVDFDDVSKFHTHGKGAKKASKKAQQARWLDSDNEGSGKQGEDGGGGDGGDGGGGDEGGGGAGGGGNDGGGGGDDNHDDWDFGGNKKSKKSKKKAKQEVEERKRKEEEERQKREEEDKEEQAPAATGPGSQTFLSWADDVIAANLDDDWAGFTTKKDKKKKGKKV